MNIILTGFKSCGKSTLGLALAKLLNVRFIDSDSLLENSYFRQHGQKLGFREIYAQLGEAAFRELEHSALLSITIQGNMVIATGGGIVLHPDNIQVLKKLGYVVFVDTSLALIAQRLQNIHSPLFTKGDFTSVYTTRRPLYLQTADHVFSINAEATPETLAQRLLQSIGEHTHGA